MIPLRDDADYPRLVIEYEVELELAPMGFRGDVVVEFANGEAYPIYFYESAGVHEEIEDRIKWGFSRFVAHPGLVILEEITVESMKSTVRELIETGFFTHLKPIPPRASRGTP